MKKTDLIRGITILAAIIYAMTVPCTMAATANLDRTRRKRIMGGQR